MISISAAVTIVVELIIAGIVFWLLWWLISYVAPPEPFRKTANVILAILAVLVVIGILLAAVGGQPIFRP
jgi:hypothetical protein